MLYARDTALYRLIPVKQKKKYSKADFIKNMVGSVKNMKGLTNKQIDDIIYGL